MKLEKFIKNKMLKKIMIGSISGLILIIGGITLYRTFAFYEEKKEFNVLQGRIPDFKEGDIQLAILVDNEMVESIPEKGNYSVEVSCDKGAVGSWDYNKWTVSVSNFVTKTKCDVKFTSVSESEMPEVKTVKQLSKSSKVNIRVSASNPSSYERTLTFNFSEIPGYENLTADNFTAGVDGYLYVPRSDTTTIYYGYIYMRIHALDYDSNTGTITVNYQYNAAYITPRDDSVKVVVTAIYY